MVSDHLGHTSRRTLGVNNGERKRSFSGYGKDVVNPGFPEGRLVER